MAAQKLKDEGKTLEEVRDWVIANRQRRTRGSRWTTWAT
jgi:hypothetical protein